MDSSLGFLFFFCYYTQDNNKHEQQQATTHLPVMNLTKSTQLKQMQKMRWVADKEHITIFDIHISHNYVTMAVYGEVVYISLGRYDKIYKYSVSGVLQQMFGGWGSALLGGSAFL